VAVDVALLLRFGAAEEVDGADVFAGLLGLLVLRFQVNVVVPSSPPGAQSGRSPSPASPQEGSATRGRRRARLPSKQCSVGWLSTSTLGR
jgi:hypothetical protein